MKKTLLSIAMMSTFAFAASAQTYTPAAGSPLANGVVGTAGYSQTINADIPTTANISGQQILDLLPAAVQAIAEAAITPGTTYPLAVTSTDLTVAGLPSGLSDDCDGCTVNGGSNVDIVISGTPGEAGTFTVDINSATSGSVDIPTVGAITLGGSFTVPILGDIDIPALPAALDADGYTLVVSDPNGIAEANDVFSLNFYPNPTLGDAILDVKSLENGVASVEVYSITGSRVLTVSESIRVGVNRINVDMNSLPTGVYLIKADINGAQALIRTQKI